MRIVQLGGLGLGNYGGLGLGNYGGLGGGLGGGIVGGGLNTGYKGFSSPCLTLCQEDSVWDWEDTGDWRWAGRARNWGREKR